MTMETHEEEFFEYGDCEKDQMISNNITEERETYLRSFIQSVYPNNYLYAKKSKGYSQIRDKDLTWSVIGESMTPQLTGPEAEKLFRRLREKFGKERKKMLRSMQKSNFEPPGPVYQSNWIFYKDLMFLADHIQARQKSSSFRNRSSKSIASSRALRVRSLEKLCASSSRVENDSDYLNKLEPSPTSNSDQGELLFTMEDTLKTDPASLAVDVPPFELKEMDVPTKSLVTSLIDVINNLSKTQSGEHEIPAVYHNISRDVQCFSSSIATALDRVPRENQINCVIEILSIIQKYIPQLHENPNNVP